MRTLSVICVLVTCVFLSVNAFGRMGETEQEAIARYGAPVPYDAENIKPLFSDLKELRFCFQSWRIRSIFMADKTELMTYMKIELPASKDALLTKEEIAEILAAESLGGNWVPVENCNNLAESERFEKIFCAAKNIWRSEDGNIAWVRGDYALSIISPKALAHDK